ncbi:MAG TPA: hypothetical protein VJB87_03490, partial [Candidatus Nanoarchaeia archaeon]|nr:hypothetical protein [Candidatus Nanoarchaeia archaeon]
VKDSFFGVEGSIRRFVLRDLLVNVTRNDSGTFFQHAMLPSFSSLNFDMDSFKPVVEANMPGVSIEKRLSSSNVSLVYTIANGSSYKYQWLSSDARYVMVDVDPTVSVYEVRLFSPDANGSPSLTRVAPGNVNLSVLVTGSSGYRATASVLVDPAFDSEITVNGYSAVVNVSMGNNLMVIRDGLGTPSNLSVVTWINGPRWPLYLPTLVVVNSSRVWKNGTVRIY